MTKIIIADDHKGLVNALTTYLHSTPNLDVQVIDKAHNGAELLKKLKAQQPDLILLDINMPVMNGMVTAKKVKELYPDIKILVFTTYIQQAKIERILKLGVDGFVLKRSDEAELIHAIQNVMKNTKHHDQSLFDVLTKNGNGNAITLDNGITITYRELEIIELTAQSKSAKEIGELLHISSETVISHRKRLYKRLGIAGIGDLIVFAFKHGLIDLD